MKPGDIYADRKEVSCMGLSFKRNAVKITLIETLGHVY